MEKKIRNYRIIKVAELVFVAILELAFSLVIIVNRTLRSSIFVDKSLFILCSIMYVLALLFLAVLIFDFVKIKDLKIADIQLETKAFRDEKTGLPNRTAVNMHLEHLNTPDSLKGIGCVVSEISNIKSINEKDGSLAGDKAIQEFTKLLEKSAEGFGFVGRNGGNEYITIIEHCDGNKMAGFLEALNVAISDYNKTSDNDIDVHSEYVLFDHEEVSSFSELVSKAYRKLGR